jgi:hypothetical protein
MVQEPAMDSQRNGAGQPWVPIAAAYVALSIALAFISMTLTGFKFGVGNNIFHIPYVLGLSQTKEFSGDAFYVSLSNFTSVVWPILRTICNESNVRNVFKWADFVSRASAFAGLLFLFRSCNLKTVSAMTLCLTVAALSPWLQSNSVVGEHGMFIDYFTQSEATWGFVFLSTSLLALDRLPLSYAMTGIAFAINAFVGIWLLIANTLTVLGNRKSFRSFGTRTIIGAMFAFLLFAAPVAIWIATAVHSPNVAPKFSYIYYIRQYYPNHFLIEASTWSQLEKFALLCAIGVLAALLAPNRRIWLGIQTGLILVFLVGIPLPYLIDNRFVFNLHLLRSAGLEQAIAVALSIAAAARFIFLFRDNGSQLLGLVILFSLILMFEGFPGLLMVLLSLFIAVAQTQGNQGSHLQRWLGWVGRQGVMLTWVCVAMFVLVLIGQATQQPFAAGRLLTAAVIAAAFAVTLLRRASVVARQVTVTLAFLVLACVIAAKSDTWRTHDLTSGHTESSDARRDWLQFVGEIGSSDIHGAFLVPVGEEYDDFQLQARRVVWVGWKEGAAVMWSPTFYSQWMPRYSAVSALKTPQDFIQYAQRNGIHNIVLQSGPGDCPAPSAVRLRSSRYLLCQLT